MLPSPTTTNLEPSAEDASAIQFVAGALVSVHVVPELVEMKIRCPPRAINLFLSAGKAIAVTAKNKDELVGEDIVVQLPPELVETRIPQPAAANRLPSADEATDTHAANGTLFEIHVVPELVEAQSGPVPREEDPAPATNLVPSADEATELQSVGGIPVCVQLAPEFVETYTVPLLSLIPAFAATSLVPSPTRQQLSSLFQARWFASKSGPKQNWLSIKQSKSPPEF